MNSVIFFLKTYQCSTHEVKFSEENFHQRLPEHAQPTIPFPNVPNIDVKPVEHFLKAVDEITAKDIASTAQKLLSSPLTMASYGDVLYVPSYDAVSSRFHSK
ncbi:unnamed protein product [Fraxinus pennsylvanica]|uniref:Uncharacterized protein n=1 Tax=Fraxinus pennsylvanica TaxID=56036 RepID=A0AAD2DLI4_9LAMI|nr:unnamed protein product [Fraxinus pennsylvanica]